MYGIFERLAFLDGEILHAASLDESNAIIVHGAVTHVQKQPLEDGFVLSEHLVYEDNGGTGGHHAVHNQNMEESLKSDLAMSV